MRETEIGIMIQDLLLTINELVKSSSRVSKNIDIIANRYIDQEVRIKRLERIIEIGFLN